MIHLIPIWRAGLSAAHRAVPSRIGTCARTALAPPSGCGGMGPDGGRREGWGPWTGCLLSVEIEEGVRVFHLRSPARRGYRQYPRKLEIASRDQFVSEDAIEQL